VVLGVPTLFQMWLQTAVLAHTDFSRLRWFISGGAPCPPSLIDTWHKATGTILRQGYGLTEVGPNCFCMSNEEATTQPGSVGKPIFHSRMRLVDENGQDVPVAEAGELIISGPHVCAGYLDNPEATAAALRDGWFYTGDMARRDEAGYFYIVGRFKDMLISGGENVYAAEVEAVFSQHPAVVDCALIGRPDDKWGEVGLMVTVLAPGQTAAEADLRDFCRQRLAPYKVPKEVIFVDSLPYSPYGKVMKSELRRAFLPEGEPVQ
jgi:fatty-acyl-CoA synthase